MLRYRGAHQPVIVAGKVFEDAERAAAPPREGEPYVGFGAAGGFSDDDWPQAWVVERGDSHASVGILSETAQDLCRAASVGCDPAPHIGVGGC